MTQSTRDPLDLPCARCGNAYRVNVGADPDLWDRIARGRQYMCPRCVGECLEELADRNDFKIVDADRPPRPPQFGLASLDRLCALASRRESLVKRLASLDTITNGLPAQELDFTFDYSLAAKYEPQRLEMTLKLDPELLGVMLRQTIKELGEINAEIEMLGVRLEK